MKLVNLTPHSITILSEDGEIISEIAPSGKIARIHERTIAVREENGVAISDTSYSEIENLPDPEPDTYYIVSLPVALAMRRPDLLVVNAVRDSNGRVIGTRGFKRAFTA